MRDLHLEETGEELPRGYRMADNDEAVDMDEESKDTTDSDLDDEADDEPDATLGEDDEIEEVEGEEPEEV